MPSVRIVLTLTLLLTLIALPSAAAEDPAVSEGSAVTAPFERCRDTIPLVADPEQYADTPVYVSNEQPTEAVQRWARSKPGYAGLWIDRDNLGWLTVAFTKGLDKRQRGLDREFPGVGVVAVKATSTQEELRRLQRRLDRELPAIVDSWSTGQAVSDNLVHVGVSLLSTEVVEALAERFAGEPLCIDGPEAQDLPAPGPQPTSGDGWELVSVFHGAGPDQGPNHRTGIAADADAYAVLWSETGIPGDAPMIDFIDDVVVWFALGHGSSCPDLRLDDVVVDMDRSLVYPFTVMPDNPISCTDDLVGTYQFVVALDRDRLPPGPFVIRNSGDDHRGGGNDATAVDVDLSSPGSTATTGDIHMERSDPSSRALRSGAIVESVGSASYLLDARCGVGYLGELNAIDWTTETSALPEEWLELQDKDGSVLVEVRLRTEPEPTVTAAAGGVSIIYRPTVETPPACES